MPKAKIFLPPSSLQAAISSPARLLTRAQTLHGKELNIDFIHIQIQAIGVQVNKKSLPEKSRDAPERAGGKESGHFFHVESVVWSFGLWQGHKIRYAGYRKLPPWGVLFT